MAQLQDKQIKKKGDVTSRNVVDNVEANGYYATGNSARVLDFELKQCYVKQTSAVSFCLNRNLKFFTWLRSINK